MDGQEKNPDPVQIRRVELILQQLDELPTISAVAVRLLELTTAEDSEAREVIELVESDPALAGKVLALCRCNTRGRASNVATVERAVLLLGFDAVRSAVLSVQVFEVFDRMVSLGGETRDSEPVFDRVMFWQHSLASAVLASAMASRKGTPGPPTPGEAFTAGLLHDLGALALHVLLPVSFDKVCRFAEAHGVTLDEACSRIIGLDTRTAGKRLAEHWALPKSLTDVLWLHGQRFESLPDLPHRWLIGVVTLADIVARQQYSAPAGHVPRGDDGKLLCGALGLETTILEDLAENLHEAVTARAAGLDLRMRHDQTILLRSVSRANEALGRANNALRHRAATAQQQARIIRAIAGFHESTAPGQSVLDTLGQVVRSAKEILGGSFFATIYQSRDGEPWELVRLSDAGRPLETRLVDPPSATRLLTDLADRAQVSMRAITVLPLLEEFLNGVTDLEQIKLMPLRCGWGVSAVLAHDCPVDEDEDLDQLEALSRTWAAAVAAAAQHAGAKGLGEQLADANRVLVETQSTLAKHQTMAALGAIAAGAAHEMNNPLAVISGRSQLLAERLREPEQRLMAEQIAEQAHKLSDMISALRDFAEPPSPKRSKTDLRELVFRIVQRHCPTDPDGPSINTILPDILPPAFIDPDQINVALGELIRNATESKGVRHIELRVQTDPLDDRLKIQVTDDGEGMSLSTLAHAFDPFFSAKPAGRQPGLGLARARRIAEAHGGQVELVNGPSVGAIATFWINQWRENKDEQRHVA
ncbi:MAG: HDOD domain-containing protein [Phycisphaerales bacterium]|nr:MAG: HDOD domain-containing protein [Phycisphaerales bacterium]